MSGFRVMGAFAAGATIAGMIVGVARLTDVIEPSMAVAEPTGTLTASPPLTAHAAPTGSPEADHPERSAAEGGAESRDAEGGAESRDAASAAERSRMTTAIAASERRAPQERRPARWRAPTAAPEEVTAGVLARVASRRAQAACERAGETAAVEPKARKRAPPDAKAAKAERCPPEEGIESVEIDWGHGSTSTR